MTHALSDASPNALLSSDGLWVESLDLEAQGIAHRADGKVVFVTGALPSERVDVQIHRRKNNWEKGTVTAIHRESSQRVKPICPHFGLHTGACGGCNMQHLHVAAQVAVKQRALEDALWHVGQIKAQTMLRPIEGPAWGYRFRARLSLRYVQKKGTVLIGFHERESRYVADMKECPVLPAHVSALLLPLRALIAKMDDAQAYPQIELACSERISALVLRHLKPLSVADLQKLRDFAIQHEGVQWWLQPKGPETAHVLDPGGEPLRYALPEFGLSLLFKPTDFTQVNPFINQVLVSCALQLLDVQKHERVLDWFCGLGNFTLPIATRAREVVGVEGSTDLVARARENFLANQASQTAAKRPLAPTTFVASNLFETTPETLLQRGQADKWLIDPPREGAWALVQALATLKQRHAQNHLVNAWAPPRRIVYVSCHPATLARDAALLVTQAGFRCTAAGVVNMFAHTGHVESIAVFDAD